MKIQKELVCAGALCIAICLFSGVSAAEEETRTDRFNQGSRKFNYWLLDYMVEPVARGYNFIIPKPAQKYVGNVANNLERPRDTVNSLLQLKPKRAGRHFAALLVNTTVGVGGIFVIVDPDQPETGNETLGTYGLETGDYLILPLVHETSPREFVGDFADLFLDPLYYLDGGTGIAISFTARTIERLNHVASFMPSAFASQSEWEAYEQVFRERNPYRESRELYYENQRLDVEE